MVVVVVVVAIHAPYPSLSHNIANLKPMKLQLPTTELVVVREGTESRAQTCNHQEFDTWS